MLLFSTYPESRAFLFSLFSHHSAAPKTTAAAIASAPKIIRVIAAHSSKIDLLMMPIKIVYEFPSTKKTYRHCPEGSWKKWLSRHPQKYSAAVSLRAQTSVLQQLRPGGEHAAPNPARPNQHFYAKH